MEANYYDILGVANTATGEEIRAAYKQLALTKHPDKDHSNPNATADFQKILEAYVVLKDENKRKAYDNGKLNEMFSDDEDDDDHYYGGGETGAYYCPDCGTWHEGRGGQRRGPNYGFASFFNAYFNSRFSSGFGPGFFSFEDDFDGYYSSRRERRRGGRRYSPPEKTPSPPLKKPDVQVDDATGVVTISWPEVEFDSKRQDVALMFTVTGKTKPRRIWRGVGTKVSITGLDPGTYGAIIQLASKQGVAEGRLSMENQFKVPRVEKWTPSNSIKIASDQSTEVSADQPFPNSAMRARKPHRNEPPKSDQSSNASKQSPSSSSSTTAPEPQNKRSVSPPKEDSPARKLSKQLDSAISKRSIEQLESLLAQIKVTPGTDETVSPGQIRSAERILRLNSAIKSASKMAEDAEKMMEPSKLEKAEADLLQLIEGLHQTIFEYNLKTIRDRKQLLVSLQKDERIIKEALLSGSLSDIAEWVRSLSKAERREPLRLKILSQAQLLVSIHEAITTLTADDDSIKPADLAEAERTALNLWKQYSQSSPVEFSQKVKRMIDEAVEDKNARAQERSVLDLAVAPPTVESLDELERKFSALSIFSQSRVKAKLEPHFVSKVRTLLGRNDPNDHSRLKKVLQVGSNVLEFEYSDIGDLFAQAWARMDAYEHYFAAIKEAGELGITLSDQQRGLILADPVDQFNKIKEQHKKKIEEEKIEAEKRREAQRRAEAEQKRLAEEARIKAVQANLEAARAKADQQRRTEEARRAEQQKREAQARRIEEQMRTEAIRREQQRQLEESRRLEEQKRAEARQREQQKRAEETRRQAEQQKRAEETRRQAEQVRQAAMQLEQQKRLEEARRQEEQTRAVATQREQERQAELLRHQYSAYPGYQAYPTYQAYPVNPGYQAYPSNQGYPGYQSYPVDQGYQAYPVDQDFDTYPPDEGYQAYPVDQDYDAYPPEELYQGHPADQDYEAYPADQSLPVNTAYVPSSDSMREEQTDAKRSEQLKRDEAKRFAKKQRQKQKKIEKKEREATERLEMHQRSTQPFSGASSVNDLGFPPRTSAKYSPKPSSSQNQDSFRSVQPSTHLTDARDKQRDQAQQMKYRPKMPPASETQPPTTQESEQKPRLGKKPKDGPAPARPLSFRPVNNGDAPPASKYQKKPKFVYKPKPGNDTVQ